MYTECSHEQASALAQVRNGYDSMAERYLADRAKDSRDHAVLSELTTRLPAGSRILDAGCGNGVPITQELCGQYQVVGVDFSIRQLRLAKAAAAIPLLACQDLTQLGFAAASFDAVCSYYAIVHIPRNLHAGILSAIHGLLVTDGLALLCLGADDNPAQHDDFMGTPMFWSHYDAKTNLDLMRASGFDIVWSELVADDTSPGSEHLFALGRKIRPPLR